jgi:hypothetical protein
MFIGVNTKVKVSVTKTLMLIWYIHYGPESDAFSLSARGAGGKTGSILGFVPWL